MSNRFALIYRVDAFLARYKMNATAFGKSALGDPNFVFQLRQGRKVMPRTIERVDAFMDEYEASAERVVARR